MPNHFGAPNNFDAASIIAGLAAIPAPGCVYAPLMTTKRRRLK